MSISEMGEGVCIVCIAGKMSFSVSLYQRTAFTPAEDQGGKMMGLVVC